MSLQEYKCPNCSAPIQWSPGLQEMVCPYCESVISTEAFQYADENAAQSTQEQTADWRYDGGEWRADDGQDLVVFTCNSCSGEIIGERTMGASACPFCNSPVVVSGTFSGAMRPNLVIPFKLDKQYALNSLDNHYKKKKLLPDSFKDQNHLNEVKGVYVPFWLYYADTDGYAEYRGTKVRTWMDSRYIYTETSHYRLLREGSIGFDAVPADGSIKIDDTLMESIEPFYTAEAKDFNNAYLAGFYANKYDLDASACTPRVNERITNSTAAELQKTTAGYAGVSATRTDFRINSKGVYYALLPVWLLASNWQGQNFLFAMNGQTGKFVGDLPLDKKKRMRYFWGMFGIFAAALLLITQVGTYFADPRELSNHLISGVVALVLSLIIPWIVVSVWTGQLKSVKPKNHAADYVRPGSFNLRMQRDIFLYRNVTKVPLPQSNNSRRR